MSIESTLVASQGGAAAIHSVGLALLVLGGSGTLAGVLLPRAAALVIPGLVLAGAGAAVTVATTQAQLNITRELERLRAGQDAQAIEAPAGRPPPANSIQGLPEAAASRPPFGCYW